MDITENQKALVGEIGLEVKEINETKEVRIITPSGLVPNGTEIADTYYPALWEKVVFQQVIQSLRSSELLEGVIEYEDWINGNKEVFYTGILSLNDYNKEIKIADFNPSDENMYSIKFTIDFQKYTSKKLDRLGIIAAFTSPATLERFVEAEIALHLKSINNFIQNKQAAILALDPSAPINMVYDAVIDIVDVEPLDVMKDLQNRTLSLFTSSSKHLALTDDTIKYSISNENQLGLIWNTAYKAVVNADVNAVLYHPEKIMPGIKNKYISFADVEGATNDLSYAKLLLIDKQAITRGYKISNLYWAVRVLKGQEIQELHNQFGFAILPQLVKIGYYDSSEYTGGAPALKNTLKKNAEEATKNISGGKGNKSLQDTKYIVLKDIVNKNKKEIKP